MIGSLSNKLLKGKQAHPRAQLGIFEGGFNSSIEKYRGLGVQP